MNRCCCSDNGCCTPKQENKKLQIDFLYLDLSVCERCRGTDRNLENAIGEVAGVLKAAGFDVSVNKVNITSKELAIHYRFISSPTIRINGKDIMAELKESTCKDCGDLCGDQVECRVWTYEGKEYTEPPREMIVNAILREIYGGGKTESPSEEEYRLPQNLALFFEGLDRKSK